MTGFEPQTSSVKSNHSTYCTTTTALIRLVSLAVQDNASKGTFIAVTRGLNPGSGKRSKLVSRCVDCKIMSEMSSNVSYLEEVQFGGTQLP